MTASGAGSARPGDPRISAVACWRAGLRLLLSRPEPVLVPILVAGIAWVVAEFVLQAAISGTVTRSHPCVRRVGDLVDPTFCAADSESGTQAMVLTTLGFCFLGLLFWAVALWSAHRVLDPGRARPTHLLARVLGTAAVLAVALTLGIGTGLLPGLLIAFLAQFAMVRVVVDGAGPLRSLIDSAREVVARPRYALASAALGVATLTGGAALLVVGLWPATAVLALVQVIHRDPTAAGVGTDPLGTMAR